MNLNHLKYKLIRKLFKFPVERTPKRGFIIIQVDGLSYEAFKFAIEKNYFPKLKKLIKRNEFSYKMFKTSLPSNTPYFQKVLFYGDTTKYPGFRWIDKKNKKYYSFKLPETAELEEKKIKQKNLVGILKNGASYYNIFSGDAQRNYLVLSKILTKSISSKIGGLKLLLIILLNIPTMLRVLFWSLREIFREFSDWFYFYINNLPQRDFKLFPIIRIFNNVIVNEYITQGVCMEIICGTPKIFATYNAYDEASHQRGVDSKSSFKVLKLIDKSIWKIYKMTKNKKNFRKYDIFILSDHGQKKSLPFSFIFKKKFSDLILKYEKNFKITETGYEMSALPIIEKIKLLSKERKIPKFVGLLFPEINSKKFKITKNFHENIKIINFGSFSQIYFLNFQEKLTFEKINKIYPLFLLHILSHKSVKFLVVEDNKENVIILEKSGFIKVNNKKIIEKSGKISIPMETIYEIKELAKSEHAGDILIFGNIINGKLINFEGQMSSHGTFYDEEINCFLVFSSLKKEKMKKIQSVLDLHNFFKSNYQ